MVGEKKGCRDEVLVVGSGAERRFSPLRCAQHAHVGVLAPACRCASVSIYEAASVRTHGPLVEGSASGGGSSSMFLTCLVFLFFLDERLVASSLFDLTSYLSSCKRKGTGGF